LCGPPVPVDVPARLAALQRVRGIMEISLTGAYWRFGLGTVEAIIVNEPSLRKTLALPRQVQLAGRNGLPRQLPYQGGRRAAVARPFVALQLYRVSANHDDRE